MLKNIAEILSVIFHPLILTTLLVGLLLLWLPEISSFDISLRLYLLLLVFLLNYAIPLMLLGALKLLGLIDSFYLNKKEERFLPFIMIALVYATSTYLLFKLPFSEILLGIFISVSILIFLVAIISLWFKISVHAAGIWGFFGCLLAIHLYYPDGKLLLPLLGAILLAGIISASRLLLNEHSPAEVHAGAVLGFAICFGTLYYIL